MHRNFIMMILCFWMSNALAEIIPMAVLTGGAAFVNGLDSSTEFPIGLSQYDYEGDRNDATRLVFGGLVGAESLMPGDWLLQMGLAYYQYSNLPVEGDLTQGVDAHSSDEFEYEYNITSYQALLEAKLLVEWGGFYPYISGGVGAVFNHASDYEATLTTFDACQCSVTPNYGSYTQTAFSYKVGAGVDYDILPYLRLGVGYRYTDLGEAQIGTGELAGTEISETLNSVDLHVQEVVAQLTYFTK